MKTKTEELALVRWSVEIIGIPLKSPPRSRGDILAGGRYYSQLVRVLTDIDAQIQQRDATLVSTEVTGGKGKTRIVVEARRPITPEADCGV